MGKVQWLLIGAGEIGEVVGGVINYFLPLINNFVNAVLNNDEPICPLNDAVRANIIIDAVYKSSVKGKEIKIGGIRL